MRARLSRPFLVASCAAAILFAAAYSNSLENAFHFDDIHVIEQNLFIRDLANVPRFFTDARTFSALPQNQVYRPLLTTTFATDYAIVGGLNPTAFHVTQLLLFAAIGAMLTLFYRRTFESSDLPSRWAALFAATLFCLHTANSQTANYISARSEILSALGVLGAFLLYQHAPAWRRYYLYLLAMVAGALAKNLAVMFAPLLLAYKLLIEQQLSVREMFARREWDRVRPALLSSVPAFALSAALFLFIESMNPPGQSYGGGGRVAYLATQAWVWVRYAGLYFVPAGLTADTDMRLFTRVADARVLAGLVLLGASLAAVWRASRSRAWRPVAFGILWFWIALFPTSSIFPLAEVTNDHRVFFPLMGLNLAVIWAVAAALERARSAAPARARQLTIAASVGGALVLGAHAVGTYRRNTVWRDDESLWADVTRKSPRNGRALMNYGLAHMRRGRLVEARDLFTRARQFNPNYSFLEANLGVVNGAIGDQPAAERHFRRSLELDESQPILHRLYARWLTQRGRAPEAVGELRRAIALSSGDSEARHALLQLFAAQGADLELRRLAEETLRLAGTDAIARVYAAGGLPYAPEPATAAGWFALGLSFTRAEQHVDAAQAYRGAVAADPSNADAWNNLGWTLGKLGFFAAAEPALERAVTLRPSWELARNNLAWARAQGARSNTP